MKDIDEARGRREFKGSTAEQLVEKSLIDDAHRAAAVVVASSPPMAALFLLGRV